MAVLKTTPHKLSYLIVTEGYEDEKGDYHEGESYWEGCINCDAVPATGQANEISFEDGVARSYSYTVFLPANCRHFNVGDIVRIYLFDGIEREFEVKGFRHYQLQCKLWV